MSLDDPAVIVAPSLPALHMPITSSKRLRPATWQAAAA